MSESLVKATILVGRSTWLAFRQHMLVRGQSAGEVITGLMAGYLSKTDAPLRVEAEPPKSDPSGDKTMGKPKAYKKVRVSAPGLVPASSLVPNPEAASEKLSEEALKAFPERAKAKWRCKASGGACVHPRHDLRCRYFGKDDLGWVGVLVPLAEP